MHVLFMRRAWLGGCVCGLHQGCTCRRGPTPPPEKTASRAELTCGRSDSKLAYKALAGFARGLRFVGRASVGQWALHMNTTWAACERLHMSGPCHRVCVRAIRGAAWQQSLHTGCPLAGPTWQRVPGASSPMPLRAWVPLCVQHSFSFRHAAHARLWLTQGTAADGHRRGAYIARMRHDPNLKASPLLWASTRLQGVRASTISVHTSHFVMAIIA